MRRRSLEDNVIDTFILVFMIFMFILTVYPFYYALVISFNHGLDAARGGIFLWPRRFSLDNYKAVFQVMSNYCTEDLFLFPVQLSAPQQA